MPKQKSDTARITLYVRPDEPGLRAFFKAIASQLRGKQLSRARRSVGSVLLLDFGKLSRIKRKRKSYLIGEWHLFVEMADWAISKRKRAVLSSQHHTNMIGQMISPLLERRELKEFIFRPSGGLELRFADGTKLNVRKTSIKNYPENWCLFFKDEWSVGHADEKGRYGIELKI